MKNIKKLLCLALAGLLLTAGLTACTPPDLGLEVDKTITDKQLDYTFYAHGLGVYTDDNPIIQKWEEMFNIKISFEGASADWMETLALRVNANDLPDFFFFVPNDTSYMEAYANFVKKEMVLPISDFITEEETPNLYALINLQEYKDLYIDGKLYFIPSPNTSYNNTIYVRQDWLDNLGLEQPTTIEEFEEVLRAFTQDDPDGNGKNDTYGMAASKVFEWLSFFKNSFGVTPGWSKDANGVWQLDAFTSQYTDYLTWMAGLYQKGYIKNEFFLYTDEESVQDFQNGKCGIMQYNGGRNAGGLTYTMAKLDKDAVVDVLPMPNGVTTGAYCMNGDWWGGWSIAYDCEEPYRLVKFLDYLYSEEGNLERLHGLKDVHYKINDEGEVEPLFEARIRDGGFGLSEDGAPRDLFNIGAYWGSNFKIVNGKLTDNTSSSIYRNVELAEKSNYYAQNFQRRNFPMDTMSLGVEYASTYAKVYDQIVTYSIRIISGTMSVEKGVQTMKEKAEANGYAKIQKIIADAYN